MAGRPSLPRAPALCESAERRRGPPHFCAPPRRANRYGRPLWLPRQTPISVLLPAACSLACLLSVQADAGLQIVYCNESECKGSHLGNAGCVWSACWRLGNGRNYAAAACERLATWPGQGGGCHRMSPAATRSRRPDCLQYAMSATPVTLQHMLLRV